MSRIQQILGVESNRQRSQLATHHSQRLHHRGLSPASYPSPAFTKLSIHATLLQHVKWCTTNYQVSLTCIFNSASSHHLRNPLSEFRPHSILSIQCLQFIPHFDLGMTTSSLRQHPNRGSVWTTVRFVKVQTTSPIQVRFTFPFCVSRSTPALCRQYASESRCVRVCKVLHQLSSTATQRLGQR